MKRIALSAKSSYLLLFFSAWVALIFSLWFMLAKASAIAGSRWYIRLFLVAAESAFILSPYWILPRRKRWLVFLPLFIAGIWLITIIWYFRFWWDIPALSAVFLTSNFNEELFRSVISLWKPSDALAVLPAIAVLVLYRWKLRQGAEEYRARLTLRIGAITASICLFFGYHIVATISTMNYSRMIGIEAPYSEFPKFFKNRLEIAQIGHNATDMRNRGIIVALGRQLKDAAGIPWLSYQLSSEEVEKVENFISESKLPQVLSDSLTEANSQKNIVLVIVESLNSSAISGNVTPTLAALLGEPGTVSALNITTQIAAGGSGDGQLLTNTGLLPLSTFSTAVALGSTNTFPSLPRLLNRHNPTAIFADKTTSWNERNTFRSYGFDPIYCCLDYVELEKQSGADLAMITFADSVIPTLKEPFFLELISVSMHVPFDDPYIPERLSAKHITAPDLVKQSYLRVLNYFDYSLGHLINTLKERGIYDNTLLFIVSDHPQNISATGNDTQAMAFIAANTGLTRSVERQVFQSEVFPAILQLAGVNDSIGWKGAATSLLGEPMSVERMEQARDISELILRGDFFAKKSLK